MAVSPRYGTAGDSAQMPSPSERVAANAVRTALTRRLTALGIHRGLVPWLIRNLAAAHRIHPYLNLLQFNRRLHYLGWEDVELDYHTWQLALACLETEQCRQTVQ
jgi:hypothetical protein